MNDALTDLGGTSVLVCAPGGPAVRGEQDAVDLVGNAFYLGAHWVALPVERLTGDFFRLRTRLAGAVAQKFVNYRVGLAVVGDVPEGGDALEAFVRESNRGRHLWFVADLEELEARLGRQ
ncbi:DUF4180 domain-containing protein [Actinomadura kijaniata]|uniref:DUF4180 domain-containing protein n=1 Tax=Actinomadura namibiensis TaxID=182080 RepID=A0A7W3LVS4_ACTNM|nr:DUF4180 domain-containing protein [Actinomadura namibiensis]MBA8955188.1 hypothetical protein [Actinomadura namibiensis]